MSAGGYDGPHFPSTFSRYEPRRSSGSISTGFDRPPNAPLRRRTPSPGPSRRPYDSYVPPRSDISYRDSMPNVYRPGLNSYRPDYPASFYSRSPSPDTYSHRSQSRISDPDWDRGSSWRPAPSLVEAPNVWPERKIVPPSPSPTTSSRGRSIREESTRLFEPSDSWKQTHIDRPSRVDNSPSSDRHFDRRSRSSLDASPDQFVRTDRPPAYAPNGDRYRPASSKRDMFFPLARTDSYRPQYDNHRSTPRHDPISPTSSHHRRGSGSVSNARTSDRFESPRSSRAVSVSRKPSISPPPTISPSWTAQDLDNGPWSYPPSAKLEPPPRAPSRSSIASTHVSDRKSPSVPPPSLPPPITVAKNDVAPKDATEPPKALEQNGSDKKAEQPNPEVKKPTAAANGTSVRPTVVSLSEPKSVPKPTSPVVKRPAADMSIVSNDVSVTKQSLSITILDSPHRKASQISEVLTSNIPSVTSAIPPPNGAPAPAPPLPTAPVAVALSSLPLPTDPPASVINEVPSTKIEKVIKIEQPKPSYISSPAVLSPMVTPIDIDIPPPTHSPILRTPPPIDEEPTPVTIQKLLPIPEEIPPFSEAKSTADALRIVVMTRLLCDRQSREERVKPVLTANLSIANPPEAHPIATPDTLIEKMFSGAAFQERSDSFVRTRPLLSDYLTQRHNMVEEKISKLREEYVSLEERWLVHCNTLNEQQKSLASEHENQHTGRTTRRSTAITDAVRSDFEMEQIIASLGVDDATDPFHLSMRNLAKIPDMISVANGQVDYLFDDTAHLVENPSEYYGPHTGIDDWTDAEKQTFLDKFAAYPKQFGIIADFLPNKTAAQCVDYYYLHKKRFIDFRRVVLQFAPNKRKRRGMGKKKGNGLLVDIAKHDMEVYRGSTSASASPSVVARAPRGRKTVVAPEVKKAASAVRRNAVQFEDTPTSTPTPEPESRPKRRRGPTMTGTPSSAVASAVSFTVTPSPAPTSAPVSTSVSAPASAPVSVAQTPPVSVPPPVVQRTRTPASVVEEEPSEQAVEPRPVKRVKRTRKIKSAATVSDEHDFPSPGPEAEMELSVNGLDGTEAAARSKKDKAALSAANQWSEDDKNLFLSLLAQYGDDFKRIAASMPNKTKIQVSNFFKANSVALDLEKVAANAPKRSPTPEQPFPGSGVMTPVSTSNHNVGASASSSTISTPAPPMLLFSADSGSGRSHSHSQPSSSRDSAAIRPPAPSSLSRPALPQLESGNPYPSLPTHQPPMARLSSANNNAHSTDSHRPSIYSPPQRNASYPYPHVSNMSRPTGPTSPRTHTQPRPPTYLASPYASSSVPTPNSNPTGRSGSGYVPPPAVGPNAPSIVHSPTGMASPKPLPMQPLPAPMQSYPAQQSDPAGTHLNHRSYYPGPQLTWGSTHFYGPPREAAILFPEHRRRTSGGSSDDRAGSSARGENQYFGNAPHPPRPSGVYPPALVPPSQDRSGSTSSARTTSNFFYPGWTS